MKNHGGRFGPLFLTLALLVSALGGFSTASAAIYVNDGQSTISGALSSSYAVGGGGVSSTRSCLNVPAARMSSSCAR